MRNGGKVPANVTHVMGSLNSVDDFSAHYQNFSLAAAAADVPPGGEASLTYAFRPDPALPERDFQVALTAFYVAREESGAAVFFNRTVAITEPRSAVDWQLLQLLATFAGLAALAGYGAHAWAVSAGYVKRARKAPAAKAAGAAGGGDPAQWLAGTFYKPAGAGAKKAA